MGWSGTLFVEHGPGGLGYSKRQAGRKNTTECLPLIVHRVASAMEEDLVELNPNLCRVSISVITYSNAFFPLRP